MGIGYYETRLQVRDPHGAMDTLSRKIHVPNGANITGLYWDNRGDPYETYGTVSIGDQWWFSKNVSLHDTTAVSQYFYLNEWKSFYEYGNLYNNFSLINVCPQGWRIPAQDDWEKLFANYPEDKLYEALMPGGVSDFGAIIGGMGIGDKIEDVIYSGIDRRGYYWTTTKPAGGESNSTWVVTFDKPSGKVLRGFTDVKDRLFSVRCVKEAN